MYVNVICGPRLITVLDCGLGSVITVCFRLAGLSIPSVPMLCLKGSARGVMVIVTGIGHGDTSSNPGLIAFHIALIPLGKV